eukprot:1159272-Pelagomonas_calceolata.AAC.4
MPPTVGHPRLTFTKKCPLNPSLKTMHPLRGALCPQQPAGACSSWQPSPFWTLTCMQALPFLSLQYRPAVLLSLSSFRFITSDKHLLPSIQVEPLNLITSDKHSLPSIQVEPLQSHHIRQALASKHSLPSLWFQAFASEHAIPSTQF